MTKAFPVRGTLEVTFFAILFCGIAALWWDGSRRHDETQRALDTLAKQTAEIGALEAAIQALRIEQKSEAKGVAGVLEQIHHWADVLCNTKYTDVQFNEAEKSMKEALRAMKAHGPDAFQPVYVDLCEAPSLQEELGACADERRKWLLRAAIQIDPKRAKELLVRFLRGHDAELSPNPRMRWFAAEELITLDRAVAAVELREVLRSESARGVDPNSARGAIPASRSMAGFSNFINKYIRAGDDRQEETLIQILGKPEHDMITKQECVKELGNMKSRDAVPFIERLFAEPPEIANNAVFKNHCVNALVAILGVEACPWLQDAFSREQNQLVVDALRDQIVKLGCK